MNKKTLNISLKSSIPEKSEEKNKSEFGKEAIRKGAVEMDFSTVFPMNDGFSFTQNNTK